jgi:DNA-binding transcriptional LysR family regulator
MDKFQEMRTFVGVIDAGSFVGAAQALNMSKPAVSRYVGDLEARLGIRLLHRTTRKLSLTEEGEVFYSRCQEVLTSIDEAESEITSRSGTAIGSIRVNAPVTFGNLHLSGLWGQFKALHPQVTLDITLADRVVDIVEEGYDLAVRIARLPSSSLISRKLSSTRMVVCASPEYLRKAGTPAHPSDIAKHAVLAYSYWSTKDEWEFQGPSENVSVRTHPFLHCNSGDTCRAGALKHQGIILQPTFLIGQDLANGSLVEILPEFKSVELGVYVMYPTRKNVSPKVRLMIDFLISRFKKTLWPN